jgi:hypothetical protein
MTDEDTSGTEKWIVVVLKELQKATTAKIMERVGMFNQDCADRIPYVLTQMRMEGKVSYEVVSSDDGEGKNIVWKLEEIE